jgi:hypothetical protein
MAEAAQQLIPVETAPVPAVSESAAILSVIERAARDPQVDIDKMERLMAMHERMLARQAKAAYNAALAELQPRLPMVAERGGITNTAGKVQSKYALWEDVVSTIAPMLSEHGFALSFRVGRDGDRQTVTGILSHSAGHSEETTLSLPIDMSGSKNNVQGVGSTVSYGKRYTTQALLNIVTGDQDSDGQGGAGEMISAEQKQTLVALMQETGADTPKFLKYMAVASLDEIKVAHFGRAKTALEAKRKRADGQTA